MISSITSYFAGQFRFEQVPRSSLWILLSSDHWSAESHQHSHGGIVLEHLKICTSILSCILPAHVLYVTLMV